MGGLDGEDLEAELAAWGVDERDFAFAAADDGLSEGGRGGDLPCLEVCFECADEFVLDAGAGVEVAKSDALAEIEHVVFGVGFGDLDRVESLLEACDLGFEQGLFFACDQVVAVFGDVGVGRNGAAQPVGDFLPGDRLEPLELLLESCRVLLG